MDELRIVKRYYAGGPQGPKGPQGIQGEQGPLGIPGPQGPKGDKGDSIIGPMGPQGPKGDKGDRGDKGDKGDKGDAFVYEDFTQQQLESLKGPKGDKGDTGETGPQGPKGDTGETGPQGILGPKGDKGDTGEKGDTGLQGPKGDTGEQGPAGQDGVTPHIDTVTGNWFIGSSNTNVHAQGPLGIQGETGQLGPQGEQGIQGIQGVKGDQGEQGATGPQGPKGDTGEAFSIFNTYASIAAMNADIANVPTNKFVMIASDVEDPDNAKLYVRTDSDFRFITDFSGAQGLQGPQGEQGPQGTPGLQGQQGVQGELGILGIQGPAGSDGITPHIDSTTGNWFIGTTDTGVHAQGPAGTDGQIVNQAQADWNQTDNTLSDFIKNKPTIPTVPTNISSFTNDVGYLTSHLDISGKANSADLATVATSGSYNDLSNKPTIPTKITDLENDSNFLLVGVRGVDQNLYVDMGLPSGTLWAKKNIDVTQADGFAASEYRYECSFFSWGNVDGHNPTSTSSFSPYSFGLSNTGEPYVSSEGAKISYPDSADSSHDAAYVNIGDKWRMPATEDFAELFDSNYTKFIDANGNDIANGVTNKIVTVNSINGIRLKSKINGNIIFFPCSGLGNGSSWKSRGSYGYYWSRSLSSTGGRGLSFYSGGVGPQYNGPRSFGFAVRPVINANLAASRVAISGDYNDLINKPTIPTVPSNQSAASGGTTLSVVTTGEKYTWNNKANVWRGTQAQYDAITTPDANTIYIITSAS